MKLLSKTSQSLTDKCIFFSHGIWSGRKGHESKRGLLGMCKGRRRRKGNRVDEYG
jgi:hypothetical protein